MSRILSPQVRPWRAFGSILHHQTIRIRLILFMLRCSWVLQMRNDFPLPASSFDPNSFPHEARQFFLHKTQAEAGPLVFLVNLTSICWKGVNSFFWSSGDIPIPVSSTENSMKFLIISRARHCMNFPSSGCEFSSIAQKIEHIPVLFSSRPPSLYLGLLRFRRSFEDFVLYAFSLNREMLLSRSLFYVELTHLQFHLPCFQTFDRSRMSLI